MLYEITDDCAGCTMCAKNCPAGAIMGERRQLHFIDHSRCKQCGNCWRQCPKAAVLDPHGRRRVGKPVKTVPRPVIDGSACAGCQTCLLNCPFEAISYVEARLPLLSSMGRCQIEPQRCQGCASCVALCPTGAAVLPAEPELRRASQGGR